MIRQSGPGTFVGLPPGRLTVGQPDVLFPMSHRDWARLRRRVDALKNRVTFKRQVSAASAGASLSLLTSFVLWLPAYGQLQSPARLEYSWVAPGLAIACVSFALLAIVFLVDSWQDQNTLRRSVEQILEDMDEMYAPHRAQADAEAEPPAIGSPVSVAARRFRPRDPQAGR